MAVRRGGSPFSVDGGSDDAPGWGRDVSPEAKIPDLSPRCNVSEEGEKVRHLASNLPDDFSTGS